MFKHLLITSTTAAAILAIALIVAPVAPAGSGEGPVTDQYAFGQDAVVTHPVTGNVQVIGGNADIREVIYGDLLVFGGSVIFSARGRVNGNVIFAGGKIVNGENRVGGKTLSLSSLEGAAASMTQGAIVLSLLFGWLVAGVVLTLISGREIRLSSVEIRASTLYCFVLGLVAVTSFVLTAIVFSYLVPYLVGLPLLAALGVFAILTKIYGMVAMFHAVGTLVFGAKTREQLAERKWFRGDIAMVAAGVLILGAIRMIPVVGIIAWSMASIFGVGVALATKFGRREPWFLIWRPAEA